MCTIKDISKDSTRELSISSRTLRISEDTYLHNYHIHVFERLRKKFESSYSPSYLSKELKIKDFLDIAFRSVFEKNTKRCLHSTKILTKVLSLASYITQHRLLNFLNLNFLTSFLNLKFS